jgi:general secretion pathway protein G
MRPDGVRLTARRSFPVFAIIFGLVLLYLWLVAVDDRDRVPRESAIRLNLQAFLFALKAYKTDVGEFPTEEEGLQALRSDFGHKGWLGPYVDKPIPPDPWGHVYQYGILDDGSVEVRCVGPEHTTIAVNSSRGR